jgi:peptide deformylase
MKFEGFEARLFQHEFDHLSGVLFIDRLDVANKRIIKPQLEHLERQFALRCE